MTMRLLPIIAAALLLAASEAVPAAEQRIEFPSGTGEKRLEGKIRGDGDMSYLLAARAGQMMTVTFEPTNLSANFNVNGPRSATDGAIFTSATSGANFNGILSETGDYQVQVFLMRSAARRDETSSYAITIKLEDLPPDFADSLSGGPDFWQVSGLSEGGRLNIRAEPSTGAPVLATVTEGTSLRNGGCRMTDAERWCKVTGEGVDGWAAGRFLREGAAPQAAVPSAPAEGVADLALPADVSIAPDAPEDVATAPVAPAEMPREGGTAATVEPGAAVPATATISCGAGGEEPMRVCDYEVVRVAPGEANFRITLDAETKRQIHFESNRPTFTDAEMPIIWTVNGDLFRIGIGAERFEIPISAVNGG